MKLGKILTRGLGAGLQAYGKTLTDQDARDQKQRELDGVLMREQALANWNHGLALDTIDATAAANIAQSDATEQIKTREEGLRLGPVTDAKIRADAARIKAEADAEYQLLPAKTRATITIEEYRQNRLDARATLDRNAEDARAAAGRQVTLDTHPTATVQNDRGEVVTAYAPGATTRVTTLRGSRPLRRGGGGGDDDGETTLQGARGGGAQAARGSAAAAPTDKAAMLASDKAHLAQIYPNATEAAYPGFYRDGKKLPMDELAKALEDDYGI